MLQPITNNSYFWLWYREGIFTYFAYFTITSYFYKYKLFCNMYKSFCKIIL